MDGEEEADRPGDVVPGIVGRWKKFWRDNRPHVAPGIETGDDDADQGDVQPDIVSLPTALLFQAQARNRGDQNLGKDPEFPHGAVMQLKAQQVQRNIEDQDLEDDVAQARLKGRARLPVDVLFISQGPLQAVDFHQDPDCFADGQQEEKDNVAVFGPSVQKDPDPHEVRRAVEGVHVERVRALVVFFSEVDRDDVDQQAENDARPNRRFASRDCRWSICR